MLIGCKLFSSLIKYYSPSYWLRILLHPMLINPQGQPFFSLGLVGFLTQWVTSHDLPLSEFTFYPVTADSALSILLIQLFLLVFSYLGGFAKCSVNSALFCVHYQ